MIATTIISSMSVKPARLRARIRTGELKSNAGAKRLGGAPLVRASGLQGAAGAADPAGVAVRQGV
jgi:hypothetical protein